MHDLVFFYLLLQIGDLKLLLVNFSASFSIPVTALDLK